MLLRSLKRKIKRILSIQHFNLRKITNKMSITAKQVAELRGQTGAGLMDCKKALTESDGDLEQAITILRKKGIASASKKEEEIPRKDLLNPISI